jgi:hypothetical protein
MSICPFTESVINCYWTVILIQGFFLRLGVSKQFGTGWYCNSKTNVILCDCYKLCLFVRTLKINWFVVLWDERFCLTGVLLQAKNLELKLLFCFRPEAVCQQKQNQNQQYIYRVIKKSLCTWRTVPTQLMIWRWPSQNTFGMLTMLYWTRSSRTVRCVNKCLETGGGHFEHYL